MLPGTRQGDLSDPERLARLQRESGGAALAVDKASTIDTIRVEILLWIARGLGVARVVPVGNMARLLALDAGQPFRVLHKAGMATAANVHNAFLMSLGVAFQAFCLQQLQRVGLLGHTLSSKNSLLLRFFIQLTHKHCTIR